MTTIDFPVDPELIAEVESAFARRPMIAMVQLPKEFHSARGPRWNGKDKDRLRRSLVRKYEARCTYCGVFFDDPRTATLDHIIPHTLTRTCALWDLALACEDCNRVKGCQIPEFLLPLLVPLIHGIVRRSQAPVERGVAIRTEDQQ